MSWLNSIVRSLSARLIALFTIALLPLALISISQTQQIVSEADRRSNAALLAKTSAASADEKSKVQNTLGAAQGLAATIPSYETSETCSAAMRAFLAENPRFVFAGYIPRSGVMTCSPSSETVDFSEYPGFDEFFETAEATVVVNPNGTVSQQPVFIVSTAVRTEGEVIGFLSISVPLASMEALSELYSTDEIGFALATINQNGNVVSAPGGVEAALDFLPSDTPLEQLPSRAGEVFPAIAGDGTQRMYAVTSVIDEQVALVGSWPIRPSGGALNGLARQTAIGLPLLTWIAGVLVAYFGLRLLVIRHIEALRGAMGRFALGERGAEPLALETPPLELAEAEKAFNSMAQIITKAEERREADLRDKEVLLKEVHHRVKNNLQLIASIMNMQSRAAKTEETRETLAVLQQRVRGLAMLHRTLYTTPDLSTVNGADLMRMVADDVSRTIGAEGVKIELELEDVELFPDQAVPMSMLVAEVLSNALKYSASDAEGRIKIQAKLASDQNGRVCMSVKNPCAAKCQAEGHTAHSRDDGLGSKLMEAFVDQLGGTSQKDVTDATYSYAVSFQRRDFEPPSNLEAAL